MNDNNKVSQILAETGLALILTAIPLGMYAKIFLNNMTLAYYLVAIGALLIIPYRRIVGGDLLIVKRNFIGIFAFFTIASVYYFLSKFSDSNHLLYNTLTILVCISLNYTRYEEDIKLSRCIRIIWALSFICVVLGYIVIKSGLYGIYASAKYHSESDLIIFDLLTAASICITNMICTIYLFFEKKLNGWLYIIGACIVAFDIYTIVLMQKRTPMLVAISVLMFYIFTKIKDRGSILSRGGIVIGVCVFGYLSYRMLVTDTELVASLASSTSDGLKNMFEGTKTYDATNSAAMRYYARKEGFELIHNFVPYEYILGAGYMTKWLDIPLLQSYLDMGIFGLLSYFFFIVWLPIKNLFSNFRNKQVLWATFLALYGALASINSGYPYDYVKWIPICVLVYVVVGERAKENEELYDEEEENDDIEEENDCCYIEK